MARWLWFKINLRLKLSKAFVYWEWFWIFLIISIYTNYTWIISKYIYGSEILFLGMLLSQIVQPCISRRRSIDSWKVANSNQLVASWFMRFLQFIIAFILLNACKELHILSSLIWSSKAWWALRVRFVWLIHHMMLHVMYGLIFNLSYFSHRIHIHSFPANNLCGSCQSLIIHKFLIFI